MVAILVCAGEVAAAFKRGLAAAAVAILIYGGVVEAADAHEVSTA